MSRNSKNARLNKESKERSAARKNGTTGPARTSPKHGKTKAWWQLGSYFDFIKGKGKKSRPQEELVTD